MAAFTFEEDSKMSRQALVHDYRQNPETPRISQNSETAASYSAMLNSPQFSDYPAARQRAYIFSGSSGYDDAPYMLSPPQSNHGFMPSATASPQATPYFTSRPCYVYPPSPTPMVTDYHSKIEWCGEDENINTSLEPASMLQLYDEEAMNSTQDQHTSVVVQQALCKTSCLKSSGVMDASEHSSYNLKRNDPSHTSSLDHLVFNIDNDGLSCGTHSDDGSSDDLDVCDYTEDRILDEPYAKLIYRALLNAPRNSMALQQIYQWFIDNTDKVKPGQTGWRNSIRHNLSMNAAFDQVSTKQNSENSKKTSTWVLNSDALHKGGVAPTTRYRKSSKKSRKSLASTRKRKTAKAHSRRNASSSELLVKHDFIKPQSPPARQARGVCDSSPIPLDSRQFSSISPPSFTRLPIPDLHCTRAPAYLDLDGQRLSSYSFNSNNLAYISQPPFLCEEPVSLQEWQGLLEY